MSHQRSSPAMTWHLILGVLALLSGIVLFCGCDNKGDGAGGAGDSTSTVPVDVSGTWKLIAIPATIEYEQGTMTLSQTGGAVTGSFHEVGHNANFGTIDGTIAGKSINFNYVYTSYGFQSHHQTWLYWGTVNGDVMTGEFRSENSPEGINEVPWKAIRQ